jgi:general secretion pathway protein B
MSYILDALKKADRERSLTKAPTLTTVHVPVLATGRRVGVWAIVFAFLAGGGVFLWVSRPSPPVVPVPVADSRMDGGAAMPVRVAEPPPPVAPEPSAAALPSSSPAPRVLAPPVRSVGAGKLPAPPPEMEKPPTRPSAPRALDPEATPPEQTQAAPDAAAPMMPPLPVRPEPVPSQSAGRPGGPALPVPAADPAMLRVALAKMTLDVFVYTDLEADRLVVINGRRYTKGQYVDGLYLVENITAEGVVLTYQEERAVLRP